MEEFEQSELPPEPWWQRFLDSTEQRGRSLRVSWGWIVVALAASVMGWWYLAPSRDDPPPVESMLPTAQPALDVITPAPPPEVIVHVAGSVVRPGVYTVDGDARISDVIDRAGGLHADGDTDRLNLAARVVDGSRVYVPAVGEMPPPLLEPEIEGDGSPDGAVTDLNQADAKALEALPGIGPATAAAMVAHRDEHGPFVSVDALLDVPGIGPAKLDRLRPLVTVAAFDR